ncbi:response regulator [Candidatus Sumerlaeota bacterium]|nr:response regulator [Candidatus Sumerlaeota bacterium]
MAKKALIADDSKVIREIIASIIITVRRIETTETANGADAWEALQKNSYDLLITDLEMPGMSGQELVKKLRRELENTDMPVIVCTAEDIERYDDLYQIGVNAVLRKPFSPVDLLSTVDSLLK